MLSAEAYSFRLKSRLAISLSWIAGFTNVLMLVVTREVVSHQTGNVTHFAQAAGNVLQGNRDEWQNVAYFAFLVGSFLAGAVASALMTETARRRGHASKYIMPMSVEATLLCLLMLAMIHWPDVSSNSWRSLYTLTGISAFAMGLQNATITRISGAVVRTTHLTGVVTDIGLEGVQLLLWWRDAVRSRRDRRFTRVLKVSRRHPTVQRVALLASILGSFLFGATAGTISFAHLGPAALWAPVLFLMWIVLVDYFKPIADVKEIDPTRDGELVQQFGDIKSLLPPDVGIYRLSHHRAGRQHEAPDLASWADRLPHRWRVIILVISPLTHFDADSAASLLSAIRRLRQHNRHLLITGMNRVQFRVLRDSGLSDVIDLDDFVPDMEFAVARGINLAAKIAD